MICVGTRGPLTGRGLDLGIVDDPFKDRAEANSPLIRRRVHDWWRSTFYPRLEPDSVAIVIQTRWHEDDLIGFLLKQQKDRERELAEGLREDDFDRWTHLSLPALAIDGEPDALGRSSGEALWPERWPRKLLLAKRAGVGPLEWSALYQGRPQPPGTAMFRREWFRYFRIVSIDGDSVFELQRPDREEPKRISFARCSWFVCADTAMKDGQENDYTAVGVFALTPDGDLLVVEIFRARLPQTTQLPAIYDTAERWPLVSWAGVEDASSGTGLLDAAKIRGRPLRPLKPVGSKADRGMAAVVRYENGTIYHRAGAPWLLDFEDEMIEFPYGGNDDQADVLFYAVREMVALVGIVYA